MIIFGTRGVKFTKEEGDFFCPQCNTQQPYRHRSVRRFFTLYFIPVIPLDKLGEYVECRTCRGTFVPRILEYNPNQAQDEFLAEYEKGLRHAMIMMMLADGHIDEREKITVLNIINKFSHHDLDMPALDALIAEMQGRPQEVGTYLKGIASNLNAHGKETIVRCGYAVAASDDHIDDSEVQLLQEMGHALELSPAHLRGILEELAEEHARG